MAEKYGVVPPKFTKEWWSYFWMYYKWHTIAAVTAIVCVGVTIQQCVTAPQYDLTVTYTGTVGYSQEAEDAFVKIISEYTDDTNSNGEKLPFFQQLILSDDQDPQYTYAMQTKLMLEFQNEKSFVFVMDSDLVKEMIGSPSFEGAFIPVNEWVKEDINEDDIYSVDGVAYAVSLKNSRLLKEAQIPCDNLYVALRFNNETDEENTAAFESSKNILNALVQQ